MRPYRRPSSAVPLPSPGRRCRKAVRDAFASPYALAVRAASGPRLRGRHPLEPGHPSRAALDAVVDGLGGLTDVPALLVWGPRDPVFSIRYLHDLRRRLPQADVQLYPRASHLVVEDAPEAARTSGTWAESVSRRTATAAEPPRRGSRQSTDIADHEPMRAKLARCGPGCSGAPTTRTAIAELGPAPPRRSASPTWSTGRRPGASA